MVQDSELVPRRDSATAATDDGLILFTESPLFENRPVNYWSLASPAPPVEGMPPQASASAAMEPRSS